MFLAIGLLDVCTVKMLSWVIFFIAFIREAHFYSLLVWIRVEGHLQWKAHLLIFSRSELSWEFEWLFSFTFENKDVSSAKILHIEVNPSSKPLI